MILVDLFLLLAVLVPVLLAWWLWGGLIAFVVFATVCAVFGIWADQMEKSDREKQYAENRRQQKISELEAYCFNERYKMEQFYPERAHPALFKLPVNGEAPKVLLSENPHPYGTGYVTATASGQGAIAIGVGSKGSWPNRVRCDVCNFATFSKLPAACQAGKCRELNKAGYDSWKWSQDEVEDYLNAPNQPKVWQSVVSVGLDKYGLSG